MVCLVLPELGGDEGVPGEEVPGEEIPGTPGSGRVLTDAVLQTQRDTISAINVIADELKGLRVVLCEISTSLKDLVKK